MPNTREGKIIFEIVVDQQPVTLRKAADEYDKRMGVTENTDYITKRKIHTRFLPTFFRMIDVGVLKVVSKNDGHEYLFGIGERRDEQESCDRVTNIEAIRCTFESE